MNKPYGFTLVELVMVIVLIGILAVTASTRFNRTEYDVESAAQELVEAIRYAQSMSMNHSGATNYLINMTSSGYAVKQGAVVVASPLGGNYQSSWSGISLDIVGNVSFDSKGKPSCSFSACTLPTDSDVSVLVSSGSISRTVQIERFTGYAR